MKRFVTACVGVILTAGAIASAQTAISVMPLGDSITAGTAPGGYRGPMAKALEEKYGFKVTTVGTQTDPSLPVGQQAHEGHGGWRIDQLADNLLGVNKVDEDAHNGYWLKGGHNTGRGPISPQVITVMAGINDINGFIAKEGQPPMSERSDRIMIVLRSRQKRLVETLTTNLPDSTVFLAGCIPYNNGLISDKLTGATEANRKKWAEETGTSEKQQNGVNHWVILFNTWIRDTYVPELQKAGKKVYYVDVYSAFILPDGDVRGWNNEEPEKSNGPAGYGDFGLHPNVFGYKLIGDKLADAIHERLTAADAK